MPVNYQDFQRQVRAKALQFPAYQARLNQVCQQAEQILGSQSHTLDELQQRVANVYQANPSLRCAVPYQDALNASFPLPDLAAPHALLAADGSQVNPSRHDPVPFAVINVGVIRMLPGKAQTPQEIIESRLLILDDLYPAEGALSEEVVALRRDLYERQTLAKLAAEETGAVVTLTDGPLELFRDPSEQTLYNTMLQEYRSALHALAELNAVTAGYVDKPASDLVVRLLELTLLPEESLNEGRHPRPLRGVTDIDLFRSLLKPGERSAVFAIQSPSARHFTGALRLHFFYLNVSHGAQPYLVRVEIPAWVALNPSLLNLLHATLLSQCRQMGIHPFPYVLHRAHEVAVVSREEKQQLQDLITNELRRHGGVVGTASHKQLHKDQTGNRTRYPG